MEATLPAALATIPGNASSYTVACRAGAAQDGRAPGVPHTREAQWPPVPAGLC
nr:hypothetical protein [uncultured Janthinobacterium sp.]